MEMLNQKTLVDIFDTKAKFYQLQGEQNYTCRSEAVIFRHGKENDAVDRIIVMANPGSCKPLDNDYKIPAKEASSFIPVVVDPTQLQLMRLMELRGWNKLKIINLSDLAAGNMDDFGRWLRLAEQDPQVNHSLFDPSRREELEEHLQCTSQPIILAWGKSSLIKKLAARAVQVIREEKGLSVNGLQSEAGYAFLHPNPMLKEKCEQWLRLMDKHLDENNEGGSYLLEEEDLLSDGDYLEPDGNGEIYSETASYLLNTNYKNNPEAHHDMLRERKAAAYYDPWKKDIHHIKKGDKVFLYQNGKGIVAVGKGSGDVESKEYKNAPDEEYFTKLDNFQVLAKPLSAAKMKEVAESQFMFASTMISIKESKSDKLWRYIHRHCL